MFVCKKCNQNSKPREKPVRVVLETRQFGEHRKGYEIVSEADYCSHCAATTGAPATIMAAAFAKVADKAEESVAVATEGSDA